MNRRRLSTLSFVLTLLVSPAVLLRAVAANGFRMLLVVLVCGTGTNAVAGQGATDTGRAGAESRAQADLRYRTVHTHGEQRTDSVTFVKGARERSEFGDTVVVTQHDTGQVIQIVRAANTYLVTTAGAAPVDTPAPIDAKPAPDDAVTVTTTVVDTGQREQRFGRTARRIRTTIERQPGPGACDRTRLRIETDAWYIDAPAALAALPRDVADAGARASCVDREQVVVMGDATLVGFPVSYTTTVDNGSDKPSTVSMDVVELEETSLDAALFEVPSGMSRVQDHGALARALSDAHEAAIATLDAADPAELPVKQPGVVRVGVPEFGNRTTSPVDPRALRSRLMVELGGLTDVRIEAVPMTAAPEPELLERARRLDCDFVIIAHVAALKVSKPGAIRGLLRAASRDDSSPRDITEADVALRLLSPDGRERLSTTTRGKDGGGLGLKTGLGLARVAGTMYLNMFAGPALMARFGAGPGNLGGLGLLGDPAFMSMQSGMLGGRRGGFDVAAAAAAHLMQQGIAMDDANPIAGTAGGPSFDESIGEALDGAARAVARALRR